MFNGQVVHLKSWTMSDNTHGFVCVCCFSDHGFRHMCSICKLIQNLFYNTTKYGCTFSHDGYKIKTSRHIIACKWMCVIYNTDLDTVIGDMKASRLH